MTSKGWRAASAPRANATTMRLAGAIGVSFILHAATLALGGSTSPGHIFRSPGSAAPPLAVSLAYADPTTTRLETGRSASDSGGITPVEMAAPESPAQPAAAPISSGDGLALPEYFPPDALTRLPEALTDFDALFPQNAEPPPGRIQLRLWLSRDGLIDQLAVLQAETPEALTSVALNTFRRMRFRPGEIRGTPVGSVADVVVEFAPGPPPAEVASR